MASVYTADYKVRFEDCDFAGIVFYPRYVLMLHRFFEDWCAEALGASLGYLHRERGMGLPAVNLEIFFKRPSKLEDVLHWSMRVAKMTSSSLTLDVQVHGPSGVSGDAPVERLSFRYVVVCTALRDGVLNKVDIPEDLRRSIAPFLLEQDPAGRP